MRVNVRAPKRRPRIQTGFLVVNWGSSQSGCVAILPDFAKSENLAMHRGQHYSLLAVEELSGKVW